MTATSAEGALDVAGEQSELGVPRALLIAALVAIFVNLVVISLTVPMPPQGMRWRLLHHAYDTGQHLAVALAALGMRGLLYKAGVHRVLWYELAATGFLWLLLTIAFWADLSLFVQRWAGAALEPVIKPLIALSWAALLVTVFHWVRRLRKPVLGGVAGLVGTATLVINHLILQNDYPGVHLALTLTGGIAVAAAASVLSRMQRKARVVQRAAAVALLVMAAGLALFAVVTRPPSALLIQILRAEGSSIAAFVARLHASVLPGGDPVVDSVEWFTDRSRARSVPPSRPNPVGNTPIVLFVTIDALRADLLQREQSRKELATLARLERESTSFTTARTPGSQTVYTLTTVFAGTYFSQQYWSTGAPNRSTRATDYLFPHADETLRFPEVLQQAHIRTGTSASSSWLVNSVGVVRGFDEEAFVKSRGEKYTLAPDLTSHALAQLARHRTGPLFYYLHYLDPHAPYDRGRKASGTFNRYMEELRYVDTELGRLVSELERMGLWASTVLIVSADHGEAFGEHDSEHHATTLYEEQLRVPLFIRAPGVAPRRVDEPVSLIDLGPTILDMFAQPTPGHFLGQSLLGFLRGQNPRLTRPIIAEGRLKKAWVFRDGFKLIVDDHAKTVELYNLLNDPGELTNVFDTEKTAESRLATLRLFFDVHRIRRPGYEIPHRR